MKSSIVAGAILAQQTNAIGALRYTGISKYQCTWPGDMTSIDYSQLTGTWIQAMTNWGADEFGCAMTRFREDDDGKANTFLIDISWTQFSHRILPNEKGTYAQTYDIKGESDGTMKYKSGIFRRPAYGKIASTDYSSYIILYSCKQDYFDLYTKEYFEILTPDGSFTDDTEKDTVIAKLGELAPDFDTNLMNTSVVDECNEQTSWWFF